MLADFFNALLVALPFEDVELVAAFIIAFYGMSFFFMIPFGFLFCVGWRFADGLVFWVNRLCEMCADVLLVFIRWLWKKVRR